MPDPSTLKTHDQKRVIEAYRDIRNRVGGLYFGDAMTALGLAANSVMRSLPPEQRLALARDWADTFVRNVYAAVELGDA